MNIQRELDIQSRLAQMFRFKHSIERAIGQHVLDIKIIGGRWYCDTCQSGWVELSSLLQGKAKINQHG